MNRYHSSHHWIAVAIVLALALLTLSEVHGQRTDASAVFEGRPAMAGAQAGTGAMAGPPQGGIGVQGQDNAQITVGRSSAGTADRPNSDAVAENSAVRNDKDVIKRDRDSGVAKDQRSAAKKVKDAIKRLVRQARHGVSDVQTAKQ